VREDSKPLSGISVRLVYQNYPAEREGHEITLTTDEQGRVLFPAQLQKASVAQRIAYALASPKNSARVSYGRRAFVFAFSSKLGGDATSDKDLPNWAGSPASMKSTIVAKRFGMEW